jgi:hypothetical protein
MLKKVATLTAIGFSTGVLSTAVLSSFSLEKMYKPVVEKFSNIKTAP